MTPARQRPRLERLGLATFAPLAVAIGLTVHALVATPIVAQLAELYTFHGTDYADARTRLAFAGLPIDQMRAALDATISPDVGIALTSPVLADSFLHQRLAEGLYPRRIDQRSPYSLGLRAAGSEPDPDMQALAPYGTATLVFQGPLLVRALPATSAAMASRMWLPLLAAACSAAGLGLLVVVLAGVTTPDPLLAPSIVLLGGALAVGLLTSVATWLQLPLVGLPLGLSGIVAGTSAMLVLVRRRRVTLAACAMFRARAVAAARKPENCILGVVLAAVTARMAAVPVALWDGRSIWLLRAHQLRHAARFALGDALDPDSGTWAHPGYPLLLPGWLAHFTAFTDGWDERAASLSISILLAAVLSLDWALARARLGRWLGAALVTTIFCSVAYLTMGGYADGWLTLLLVLQLLALADPSTERLGWLAAMVVSLLKWEGWLLGATVAVACILVFPHFRARRGVTRWRPLCVFAAGLAHFGWDLLHGVTPSDYGSTPSHLVVTQWPTRLHTVLTEAWQLLRVDGYTRCHALVWAGMVGAIGAGTLGLPDRLSCLALGLAGLCAAFAVGVLTLSPFDLRWHTWTAADRLLLPAAAFALLAALGSVAGAARDRRRSPPASTAAGAAPSRLARQIALGFLTALLLVNVYRAATQSIVHDEALTYTWFIAGPAIPPTDMTPNNHVLNTQLARLAIALFGPSELSLRLPSLLGGALCLGAFFVLAREAFDSSLWFLLAVALLSLNPFFLDLVCAARGYGLATGFLLWAVVLMTRSAKVSPEDRGQPAWRWLGASLALGLSVSASLPFLLVAVSLAAIFTAMVLTDVVLAPAGAARRALAVRLLLWFALPGLLLATALSWPLLRVLDRTHLYIGWDSLGESVSELVASSLFHAATAVSSAADLARSPEAMLGAGSWRAAIVWLTAYVVLPVSAVAAGGAVIALGQEARRRGVGRLRGADRLTVLCAGGGLLTVMLEVGFHRSLQVKYPADRAAIWMVPLWTLTTLLLLQRASDAPAGWRRVRWLGFAGALAVLGTYAANFQVSYFKTWRYDASTKAFWSRIARTPQGPDAAPIRVGGHWLFEPSVNFYRRLAERDAPTVRTLPFQRLANPDPFQFDYFFLNPVDFPRLDMSGLTLVGVDAGSGVLLVAPRRP